MELDVTGGHLFIHRTVYIRACRSKVRDTQFCPERAWNVSQCIPIVCQGVSPTRQGWEMLLFGSLDTTEGHFLSLFSGPIAENLRLGNL